MNILQKLKEQFLSSPLLDEEQKALVKDRWERIKEMRFGGEAGAGIVKVTISGFGRLENVQLAQTPISSSEDFNLIEQLIVTASRDAWERAQPDLLKSLEGMFRGLMQIAPEVNLDEIGPLSAITCDACGGRVQLNEEDSSAECQQCGRKIA